MATAIKETMDPWVRDHDVLKDGNIREHLLMVDVRTPAEYAEVHIPGSLNVPLGDFPGNIGLVKERGIDKQVVLMCRTQNRAMQAYEQMVRAGVPDCHVLEGGISGWVKANHPVLEGRKAISLDRQVRMMAGGLIVIGAVLGFALDPWWHLLPAFVGAGLFYAGMTDSCMMGMLLARLPYNRKS